jgi:hypothetical protein
MFLLRKRRTQERATLSWKGTSIHRIPLRMRITLCYMQDLLLNVIALYQSKITNLTNTLIKTLPPANIFVKLIYFCVVFHVRISLILHRGPNLIIEQLPRNIVLKIASDLQYEKFTWCSRKPKYIGCSINVLADITHTTILKWDKKIVLGLAI